MKDQRTYKIIGAAIANVFWDDDPWRSENYQSSARLFFNA